MCLSFPIQQGCETRGPWAGCITRWPCPRPSLAKGKSGNTSRDDTMVTRDWHLCYNVLDAPSPFVWLGSHFMSLDRSLSYNSFLPNFYTSSLRTNFPLRKEHEMSMLHCEFLMDLWKDDFPVHCQALTLSRKFYKQSLHMASRMNKYEQTHII